MHMFSHQVAHWLEFVMVLHLLCGHDSCCVCLCIEPKLLSKLSIVHLRKTPLRSAVEIVVWLFNYTQCTEHSVCLSMAYFNIIPITTHISANNIFVEIARNDNLMLPGLCLRGVDSLKSNFLPNCDSFQLVIENLGYGLALQNLQFLHLLLPSTTLGTKDSMPRPIDKTQTKIKLRAGNRNVKEYEED
uniref:Uncharacterized protein n=1 Tax=Glossina palpalis gambiensis TaxID=67801 RepID=A0A1B0BMN0_9MUSC